MSLFDKGDKVRCTLKPGAYNRNQVWSQVFGEVGTVLDDNGTGKNYTVEFVIAGKQITQLVNGFDLALIDGEEPAPFPVDEPADCPDGPHIHTSEGAYEIAPDQIDEDAAGDATVCVNCFQEELDRADLVIDMHEHGPILFEEGSVETVTLLDDKSLLVRTTDGEVECFTSGSFEHWSLTDANRLLVTITV